MSTSTTTITNTTVQKQQQPKSSSPKKRRLSGEHNDVRAKHKPYNDNETHNINTNVALDEIKVRIRGSRTDNISPFWEKFSVFPIEGIVAGYLIEEFSRNRSWKTNEKKDFYLSHRNLIWNQFASKRSDFTKKICKLSIKAYDESKAGQIPKDFMKQTKIWQKLLDSLSQSH
jgi:hypothetical protein